MLRKDKLDTSIIFLLTVSQKNCDFLNQLNSNLTDLSEDLSDKVQLLSKTVSGTTSNFGLASLGLSNKDIIVSSSLTAPSSVHYFAKTTWNNQVILLNAASTSKDSIANTNYSGTIYYLHFDI